MGSYKSNTCTKNPTIENFLKIHKTNKQANKQTNKTKNRKKRTNTYECIKRFLLNFLITAITANVTSSELFFRDGRSLSSYVQESVIPDRHQRLEYNYSIDVLDIFKVSNTITLKDYSSIPSSLLHVAKGLIYDQLLSSTERERKREREVNLWLEEIL